MAREPTPEEKAKIAAGPRYDPGKPVKRWRGEPAEPAPPPPPAPPPTLEPVIPQPYIEPKDAKVVASDVKGNPTVLQTPDGKKHYTPFNTPMWGELGFKTDKEYLKSQRTGEPSQYVGITEGVEKPIRVSRAELAKASVLKGEKQFEAFRKMGAIPFGSKFLPGPGGYQGTDWIWIDPATIKKFKGQIIARLARRSVKKPRVVIPPKMKVDIRPPYREERPTPVIVRHPAYLKLRPAVRDMIEDPQAVVKKIKTDPKTNIAEIISEWQKGSKWFGEHYKKLGPWRPEEMFKVSLDEFSGKEQIGYFDRLETYNNRVIAYNLHMEVVKDKVEGLEKEGAALPSKEIDKYNDEMVRLNKLAESWERETAGINLENEAAVRLHNKKLENINKDFALLVGQSGRIDAGIKAINAFNIKVDKLNTRLAAIGAPGEAPPAPPKTVGNIARAVGDMLVMEYEKAAKTPGTLKQKVDKVAVLSGELWAPGVWIASPHFGTKMEDRSLANILLNIGLDLLIIVPIARGVTLLVKRALGATAKGAVRQAVAIEAKMVKTSIKALKRTYGKKAALSLKEVSQLQGVYLKRLAKLERLKAAGRSVTRQSRATIQAENKLRAASQAFVNEVRTAQTRLGKKGVVGAGFDSPEVAEAFLKMPTEIVRHTKTTLAALTKPTVKKSLKQLQADVVKAEKVLKAAQTKAPYSPDKWVDLLMDLLEKQAILGVKKSGGIAKIHQALISVQRELSNVKARMKVPGLTAKERQALKLRELRLERQQLALAEQLSSGIRKMEVDWGRGGVVMGGSRVATAVRPKTMPTQFTGAGVAVAPSPATMTAWQFAALTAIEAEIVRVVGIPISVPIEIVKGLPTIEVVKAVQAETIKAIRAAQKLAALPVEQTKLDTKLKLQVAISAQTKAALKRAVQAAPKAAVARGIALKTAIITKVVQEVAKPVPVPVGLKPVVPKPLIPKPLIIPKPLPSKKKDEEKRKRIKAAKGAIAWRQGELGKGKDVWRVGLFPYDRNDLWLTVVGRKPEGATLAKGPGSAYESLKLLYGDAPTRKITGDIGIMDFEITPTGPKTIGLRFTPDPQQRTTGDISGKRLPIIEQIPGMGKEKRPRLTPKRARLGR